MNIDGNNCCLCEEAQVEFQTHIFSECRWFISLKENIEQWSGIRLQIGDVELFYYG